MFFSFFVFDRNYLGYIGFDCSSADLHLVDKFYIEGLIFTFLYHLDDILYQLDPFQQMVAVTVVF